jgi:indoleamine 2,3-dioxygenase
MYHMIHRVLDWNVLMSDSLDLPPFMSYAASYCLFNYTLARPSEGYHYDNLRLVRAFEYGLDPKSSEAGFVLTHVDMVKETGPLVSGAVRVLDTLEQNGPRSEVNEGYREILKAMNNIETNMEGNINLSHFVRSQFNFYIS